MYYIMTITPSKLVAEAVRACVPGCPSRDTIKYKLRKMVEDVFNEGVDLDRRCDR
jgi:hypothetical protein